MPSPQQNIMTDGPGLKDRARETNAVLGAVSPTSTPDVKPVRFEPTPAEKINSKARYGSRSGEKRIDTTDMTKPLGVLHSGTPHVPKTGNYTLQKGEAVIAAKDNPMNPYAKITEGDKKPEKKLKSVHTRKAASGGWIHEHHDENPGHHPMQEHTTANEGDMLAHMKEHMGDAPAQSASEAQDQAVGAA